jgi:hypothetical protein
MLIYNLNKIICFYYVREDAGVTPQKGVETCKRHASVMPQMVRGGGGKVAGG